MEYESVRLTSVDAVTLVGWYVPSRNRAAVILLHGFGNDRGQMIYQAQILTRHGYGVLLYDLRAHGESSGDRRSMGWEDVKDIPAALQFLQNRSDVDPNRIGIHGFSIGATIAIRAGAQYKSIRAVLSEEPGPITLDDAPPPSSLQDALTLAVFGLDMKGVELRTGVPPPLNIMQVIDDIAPRPLFLISTGGALAARGVQNFYERAREPKVLWEVPETVHGGSLDARPQEYEAKIISFFDSALLGD